MKKALLLFGILMFFCSVSWGNDCKSTKKVLTPDIFGCENSCEEKYEKNSNCKEEFNQEDKKISKINEIDDDEYFIYNQCYFDKQYRNLKKSLCLTRRQENYIDNLYRDFKFDMENLYNRYSIQKNNLLLAIECDCGCCNEKKNCLKELKKEAKEKYKVLKDDINEQLCKNQRKEFKKFQKAQNKKLKKIKKYCVVYKFPCEKCSK